MKPEVPDAYICDVLAYVRVVRLKTIANQIAF
ncbi:hypothetical protein YN1HA_18520 [Sulfurisphaera ohwakuensis]